MLKKTLSIILLAIAAERLPAIDYFEKGDTLWVWANSGLKIREKPDVKSKTVETVPFKNYVIAKNYQNQAYEYSVKVVPANGDYPGFSLNGFWSEVEYNGISGFVFDGYLSHIKPLNLVVQENGLKDMFATLNSSFKELKTEKSAGFQQSIYLDGVVASKSSNDKGWGIDISFPFPLSLDEGFLIFNLLLNDGDHVNALEVTEQKLVLEYAGLCTLEIIKAGRFLVFSSSCHC